MAANIHWQTVGGKMVAGSARWRIGALVVLWGVAAEGAAAEPPAAPQQTTAVNLNYDLDAALIYTDALKRPGAAAALPAGADSLSAVTTEPTRALGLRRLRIGLAWEAGDAAAFHLTLRPDALNRAGPGVTEQVREVDTRSGDTYRPEPSVRLADAYEITLRPLAALSASLGVFEELVPQRSSYPSVLDFGLQVRFPAKFSGLRLDWHRSAAAQAPVAATLQVFQGDEDRAESLAGRDDDSFDRAPVAADPYQGVAVATDWQPRVGVSVGLLAGFYDTAVIGGRRSEVLAGLGGSYTGQAAERPVKYSLDTRYAAETWRGSGLDLDQRRQYSAALSSAVGLTASVWGLLGLSWGMSDRDPSVVGQSPTAKPLVVSGYQIDAGLLRTVGEGLSLQFMLTHERRTQRSSGPGGKESGGFVSDDRQSATLRRFGLQLAYLLNDNA